MEGIYYEDSQYDSYYQFDSSENMIVPDSIVEDDEDMVEIEAEKELSAEIVEDTYERDENACVAEDVGGQEESSRLKVSKGKSIEAHSRSKDQLLPRVCGSTNRVIEVRKEKPHFDFDLNELPMLEIPTPGSERAVKIRDFDLNKLPPHDDDEGNPDNEECEVNEDRDFDLNKLPTVGRWQIRNGADERSFILMLRLLIPEFH